MRRRPIREAPPVTVSITTDDDDRLNDGRTRLLLIRRTIKKTLFLTNCRLRQQSRLHDTCPSTIEIRRRIRRTLLRHTPPSIYLPLSFCLSFCLSLSLSPSVLLFLCFCISFSFLCLCLSLYVSVCLVAYVALQLPFTIIATRPRVLIHSFANSWLTFFSKDRVHAQPFVSLDDLIRRIVIGWKSEVGGDQNIRTRCCQSRTSTSDRQRSQKRRRLLLSGEVPHTDGFRRASCDSRQVATTCYVFFVVVHYQLAILWVRGFKGTGRRGDDAPLVSGGGHLSYLWTGVWTVKWRSDSNRNKSIGNTVSNPLLEINPRKPLKHSTN